MARRLQCSLDARHGALSGDAAALFAAGVSDNRDTEVVVP